uniref:Uncharacterized protein n=1 Tax=Chromera velia CCMP2878 TaxID=1169474 RepID=A0A0G4FQ59_9ALVE|eukprot:Cvel_18222.t1-p1 / transcript=Cvel_18222.t1 / gene=Cvel_18222 / organism=Chromera_velia_CCMP2878 / gene_product=hypothetical protein / transcript_product=hypothetical protein / location=Cvel_scaffold1497:20313-23624(-) / protein_length=916 / sequence_SO=supercontig / SO=protein_coding / is_pseudo=false
MAHRFRSSEDREPDDLQDLLEQGEQIQRDIEDGIEVDFRDLAQKFMDALRQLDDKWSKLDTALEQLKLAVEPCKAKMRNNMRRGKKGGSSAEFDYLFTEVLSDVLSFIDCLSRKSASTGGLIAADAEEDPTARPTRIPLALQPRLQDEDHIKRLNQKIRKGILHLTGIPLLDESDRHLIPTLVHRKAAAPLSYVQPGGGNTMIRGRSRVTVGEARLLGGPNSDPVVAQRHAGVPLGLGGRGAGIGLSPRDGGLPIDMDGGVEGSPDRERRGGEEDEEDERVSGGQMGDGDGEFVFEANEGDDDAGWGAYEEGFDAAGEGEGEGGDAAADAEGDGTGGGPEMDQGGGMDTGMGDGEMDDDPYDDDDDDMGDFVMSLDQTLMDPDNPHDGRPSESGGNKMALCRGWESVSDKFEEAKDRIFSSMTLAPCALMSASGRAGLLNGIWGASAVAEERAVGRGVDRICLGLSIGAFPPSLPAHKRHAMCIANHRGQGLQGFGGVTVERESSAASASADVSGGGKGEKTKKGPAAIPLRRKKLLCEKRGISLGLADFDGLLVLRAKQAEENRKLQRRARRRNQQQTRVDPLAEPARHPQRLAAIPEDDEMMGEGSDEGGLMGDIPDDTSVMLGGGGGDIESDLVAQSTAGAGQDELSDDGFVESDEGDEEEPEEKMDWEKKGKELEIEGDDEEEEDEKEGNKSFMEATNRLLHANTSQLPQLGSGAQEGELMLHDQGASEEWKGLKENREWNLQFYKGVESLNKKGEWKYENDIHRLITEIKKRPRQAASFFQLTQKTPQFADNTTWMRIFVALTIMTTNGLVDDSVWTPDAGEEIGEQREWPSSLPAEKNYIVTLDPQGVAKWYKEHTEFTEVSMQPSTSQQAAGKGVKQEAPAGASVAGGGGEQKRRAKSSKAPAAGGGKG